jgi:hypothetical protein
MSKQTWIAIQSILPSSTASYQHFPLARLQRMLLCPIKLYHTLNTDSWRFSWPQGQRCSLQTFWTYLVITSQTQMLSALVLWLITELSKSVLTVNRLLSTLTSCTIYEQYCSQSMEHNTNSTLEFITLLFALMHGTAQSQNDSFFQQKCTGGTD